MHYLMPKPAESGVRDNLRETVFRMTVNRWEKPRKARRGFCLRPEDWGCISDWEEEATSPLSLYSVRNDSGNFLNISMLCMAFCRWGNVNMTTHTTIHFERCTHFIFFRDNGGQVMVVSQHAYCLLMEQWAGVSLRAWQGGWMFPHLNLCNPTWQRHTWDSRL